MFYCDKCAKEREWPTGYNRSYGPCEICDKPRSCTNLPAYRLPTPVRINDVIGDESQMCPTCEELEWQCQCPPEPDEIINPPYNDDECGEYEGQGFEDSMELKYPLKDYDAGYDHFDQGW